MKYVIMSGKFESGNEEQQQGYKMLFGAENIQYFFDLYFHWYNLVHEMGHCIVEKQGADALYRYAKIHFKTAEQVLKG